MEGETRCGGSRLSDNVTTACICVVTEWKWVSLKKKKKKKKIFFFFFFFRETPTSPWVPFRAKFRPPGRPFRPSRPLAWSLISSHFSCENHLEEVNPLSANHNCSRRQILQNLSKFSKKIRCDISWEWSASRRFTWNIIPYLLFLKKGQNLKLSSAANYR